MGSNGRVLIDTDVLIDHLKNIESATSYIYKITSAKTKPLISVISRVELLSGTKINETEEIIIRELLKLFDTIILDDFLADLAATFRRKYSCGIADSIIAATAFKEEATLVTRNIRHFKRIAEIKLNRPYRL